MIDFFKSLVENYKWLPEFIGISTAVILLFGKVRNAVFKCFKNVFMFLTFPFKAQNNIDKILTEVGGLKVELKKNTDISENTAREVSELKSIVGHNGGGGLLDMVGLLAGWQSSEFWLRAQPGFVCDGEGRNIDSTHAYCLLLGLASKNDLSGINWKSYTDREKSNSYLAEFKDSASRRESFRGRIELFDINALSKGFWIVIAHPISAEKAKALRFVGFLYPADDKAKEIARAYNWPISIPN